MILIQVCMMNITELFEVDIDLDEILQKRLLFNKNSENLSFKEIILKTKEALNYKVDLSENPFLGNNFLDDQISSIIEMLATVLGKKMMSLPSNLRKVILGVSGGLDSCHALLIATTAFKKYDLPLKDIIAVFMPTKETSSASINHGLDLIKGLGVSLINHNIDNLVELSKKEYEIKKLDTTYENLQARLRTLELMSYANKFGGIVLGTGDLSEIALGFMTYNGDQMSMYAINQGLPKTVIREVVLYYAENIYPKIAKTLKEIVAKKVSPELLKGQESEKIIGLYEINDFIMYHLIKTGWNKEKIIYFLPQVFELEKNEAKEYVERFIRRFMNNQFKLKTLPEGPDIFGISFSERGFSLPSDHER